MPRECWYQEASRARIRTGEQRKTHLRQKLLPSIRLTGVEIDELQRGETYAWAWSARGWQVLGS